MKKTKKNIAGKVTALVLMLTVVSCCFLGSTFAKYTSSKTGTAQVGVAKWQVDGISENSETSQTFGLTADKLSPALTANAENKFVNEVASSEYTITNNSDVAALITVNALDDFTVTAVENAKYNGMAVSWNETDKKFTYVEEGTTKDLLTLAEIKGAIKVTVSTTATPVSGQTNTYSLDAKGGSTTSMTVTITVTWTTPTKDGTTPATQTDAGNRIDTLIGMYVKSIQQSITLTATQNSQIPNA